MHPDRSFVLIDDTTGTYLGPGAFRTRRPHRAVVFDNEPAAATFVSRFACEPSFRLVARSAPEPSRWFVLAALDLLLRCATRRGWRDGGGGEHLVRNLPRELVAP